MKKKTLLQNNNKFELILLTALMAKGYPMNK